MLAVVNGKAPQQETPRMVGPVDVARLHTGVVRARPGGGYAGRRLCWRCWLLLRRA